MPHTPPSSQLLHLLAEVSDSFVPSTLLFPVNISSLSCILELSARSASAVLRHRGWMALPHCCLSLPDKSSSALYFLEPHKGRIKFLLQEELGVI